MAGVGMPAADADLTAAARGHRRHDPGSDGDPDAPLQALVTNLDASDYLGRLAIGRVVEGTLRARRAGRAAATRRSTRAQKPARSASSRSCIGFEGIEPRRRRRASLRATCSSSPGSPRSRSATRSPTRANPRPLPRLERRRAGAAHDVRRQHRRRWPARTAATSPRATCASASSARCSATCRSGSTDTESPDVIEVAGRGELQLAVLIESMRREGYELAGQPARGHHRARSTASATSRSSAAWSTCPTSTSAPSPRPSRPARARSPTCAPAIPAARSSPSRRRRAASSASGRCC